MDGSIAVGQRIAHRSHGVQDTRKERPSETFLLIVGHPSPALHCPTHALPLYNGPLLNEPPSGSTGPE